MKKPVIFLLDDILEIFPTLKEESLLWTSATEYMKYKSGEKVMEQL